MKILQINCVYPQGATGKLTADIHHRLLADGHESMVLYSRGKQNVEPHTRRVSSTLEGKVNHLISMLTGYVYGGCGLQTRKIIRQIEGYRPDVVHLQCINGYFVNVYRLIRYLNEHQIPTVLTLHADFMFTANCGSAFDCDRWQKGCGHCPRLKQATHSLFFDKTHQSFLKMKHAFEGFGDKIRVVGVSEFVSKRAKQSPVMKDLTVTTLRNGVDTEIFNPLARRDIRGTLGLAPDEKMVLWVTSLFTHEKGKDYFFELADRMKNSRYRFVVVGADKPKAYEGDVIFAGYITDRHLLASYHSAADVMLCCSRQESLPTVCLEAQCCGTPVVAFDVGGVSETIVDGMGEVVPLGNLSMMADAVARWSDLKPAISKDTVNDALRRLSVSNMTEAYIALYKSMMGEA